MPDLSLRSQTNKGASSPTDIYLRFYPVASNSIYILTGGSWRIAQSVNILQGGVWRTSMSVNVKDGSTWR